MMEITFHTLDFAGMPDNEPFTIQVDEGDTFEDILHRLVDQLATRLSPGDMVDLPDLVITSALDETIPPERYGEAVASIVDAFGTALRVARSGPRPSLPTGAGTPAVASFMSPAVDEGSRVASSIDIPRPTPPFAGGITYPGQAAKESSLKAKRMKDEAPKAVARDAIDGIELEEVDSDKKIPGEPEEGAGTSTYDKNIAAEYFDVMNPDAYYPLVIDIADHDIARVRTEENILTGERKVQKRDEMQFIVDNPVIIVRPVFPGCTVAPQELPTNLNHPSDKLTFFVTPLVHGDIHGQVDFVSNGVAIQQLKLPAKVKDPRHARVIALYGVIASLVPRISEFLGIDLGSSLEASQFLPFLGSILANISLANFIAIAGIAVAAIVAGIYYVRQKPEQSTIKYRLTDFRLAVLERS